MVLIYDFLKVPSYEKLFEEEYRIAADTVVCHIQCKKIEIWSKEKFINQFVFFDIAWQVYSCDPSYIDGFKPYVLYDLEIGDRMIRTDESTEVTDIFNISIEGVDRRVIKFAQADEYGIGAIFGYWVEGVGPNIIDGFETTFFLSMTACLNSMYRNGKLIFRYDSLFRTDGVESIGSDEKDNTSNHADSDDTPIYNLQGIRIDRPVPGQPYIRDGRMNIYRK